MYIPEPVKSVIKVLEENGFEAFAVGGCVRDSLMGRVPGDYDVTTSAVPEEMLTVFKNWRVVETGLQHGTVTVVKDGMNIEVTAYRVDGEYLDNRHPAGVTFTRSLAEDLARRDFTVNAMAFSETRGLVDLYDGQADLKAKIIRCVGSAEKRFSEDGLRILRALRFSAVLGFTPEKEDTSPAIHTLSQLLCGISRERIHVELRKLLCGKCAGEILTEYSDVIAVVIPALTSEMVHTAGMRIRFLQNANLTGCNDASLRFAVLFAELSHDELHTAVRSLKMSREEEQEIYEIFDDFPAFASGRNRYVLRLLAGKSGYAHVYRMSDWFAATGNIEMSEWLECNTAVDALQEENPPNTLKTLAVSGADLIAMGITGKDIGTVLKFVLREVLQDALPNDKESILQRIRERYL